MQRHPIAIFLAIVTLATSILAGWVGLRAGMESRMAATAQRGMETILDLVAVELEHLASPTEALHGVHLLETLANRRPEFAQALRVADDANYRRIYFFDLQSRTLHLAGGLKVFHGTEIVRHAVVAVRDPQDARRGVLFEPYADNQGEQAIGAWRWLPKAALGVVVERPYTRFAQPLRWFDAAYAVLMVLLTTTLVASAYRSGWWVSTKKREQYCGPYIIERRLGDGSMGHVYLARHRYLRRVVALKRLKPHAQSDELCARFEREARLASQLSHPNIVTILDHGHAPGGGFYYAMEYIPGLTLSECVQGEGALPPGRAIQLLIQVCAAVSAMHARKLLHRDIKPDNIMVYAAHGEYDLVKLLDFGLIKELFQDASRDLTRDIRILGTPAYMAPERLIDPRHVDPRSDLYGIACVAYYLLTSHKPFEATQDSDLIQQVLHIEAPRVSGKAPRAIPADLDELIAEALDKDPSKRPPSVESFRARLQAIAAHCPWRQQEARAWWQCHAPARQETAHASPRGNARQDASQA